jgi:hypothetical protein
MGGLDARRLPSRKPFSDILIAAVKSVFTKK